MNYKLKCKECGKEVKVSTHDAVRYITRGENGKANIEIYSFDCPECDADIEAQRLYNARRR